MRILFATCTGFLAYGISLVVAAHLLATEEASRVTRETWSAGGAR